MPSSTHAAPKGARCCHVKPRVKLGRALNSTTSFPKSARLLRPAEFKNVFKDPVRFSRNGVIVLARKTASSTARVGLAVAKKHVKRAHERNRIKRLARETFRLHAVRHCGMDCVVLVRHGVADASNEDLRTALNAAWKRILEQCAAS
ncbi:MAG: ribonuclease P protein component [Halothiobacillaceae bacterium]|nr:ribonuclease P protein component [Halothiobacillaceae bacterium]